MKRDESTKIEFKGKSVSVRFYCDGVMTAGRSYYIKDHASDEWKICSADRLQKLVNKYGSAEEVGKSYTSRKTVKSPSGATGDIKWLADVCKDMDQPIPAGTYWVHPDYRAEDYCGVTLGSDKHISEKEF